MSVNRSNSQVRNLLAMFENNNTNNTTSTSIDSTSPDRGRSNGHLSPASKDDRPLSKVRSSFVSVEHGSPSSPSPAMDIDPQKTKDEHQSRQESSASLRRHSFSLDDGSNAVANLRQSMSQEEERRGSNPMVAETIPEAAIEQTPAVTTPAVEAKDYMAAGQISHGNGETSQSKLRDELSTEDVVEPATTTQTTGSNTAQPMTLPADDMPADNPDKPVSGVQEEPGSMQPSDLTDRSLVSPAPDASSDDKPAPPTDLPSRARRGTVTAADASPASVPHRPANIVATAPEPSAEASDSPKTPTSVKKASAPTPVKKSPAAKSSSTLSPKPPVRKPSNSSLTQAKSKPDAVSTKTKSPQSKPTRPRSPTRPIKVSSHLTAPTAASAARQDSQPSKASVSVSKPAVANRPQARAPAASAKPAARSSLASTSSAPKKTESKPASKGPDDGFLARMMRPTASSASKVHDKTEVKSPPKRTPSVVRPKAPVKPKTTKVEKPRSSSSGEKLEQAVGASTPQAVSDDQEHGNVELEATPAFDAATIR